MILGYNFTIKVWYILSAEEIKGQSFSSAGFHFSKAFPINFIICLTPYRKASITGAFFIKESEDNMGVRVVFPDMGKDPSIQLIEKTITENGTYDAITDGANGYSKVNVNVEGGGGGSSDFTKVNVTMEVSGENNGANYRLILEDTDENDTAMRIETVQLPSGERRTFETGSAEVTVGYNIPITKEIYLYQNNYFVVMATAVDNPSDYTVTGNAEAVAIEFDGQTMNIVKVYGDCTISVVGNK